MEKHDHLVVELYDIKDCNQLFKVRETINFFVTRKVLKRILKSVVINLFWSDQSVLLFGQNLKRRWIYLV